MTPQPHPRHLESAPPQFGEWFTSIYASPGNPTRHGMFVRAGHTPRGRMNPGPWWELTDGKGNFWRGVPGNLERSGHEENCESVGGPVPCDCGWTRHLEQARQLHV